MMRTSTIQGSLAALACTLVSLFAGSRADASCSASLTNQVLILTGDANANGAIIVQNDDTDSVDVFCDSLRVRYASTAVDAIDVDLQDGDDALDWSLAPDTDLHREKDARIRLGEGNDYAFLEFRGGIDGDVTLHGGPDVVLDAGAGDDVLYGHFGRIRGGRLVVKATMGAGDDECRVQLWGDVFREAEVAFDLRGGDGDDVLGTWNTFDSGAYQYESIDISAGSTVELKLDGGRGTDALDALYGGRVEGKLVVRNDGGTGDDGDDVESIVKARASRDTGALDSRVAGRGGDDLLAHAVQTFESAEGHLRVRRALTDCGPGFDTYKKTWRVGTLRCEAEEYDPDWP